MHQFNQNQKKKFLHKYNNAKKKNNIIEITSRFENRRKRRPRLVYREEFQSRVVSRPQFIWKSHRAASLVYTSPSVREKLGFHLATGEGIWMFQ